MRDRVFELDRVLDRVRMFIILRKKKTRANSIKIKLRMVHAA